jgi:hypothetical protein
VFDRVLAAVARALDGESIPYMVVGGQAVLLHGEPCLTKDIAVTIAAGLDRLDALLRAAAAAGLEPLVDPEEFTRRTMVLPCSDPGSGIRVDLILSFSPYEGEAVARAEGVRVGGTDVRFATAEDLVIHKVMAGRPRDLEDARGILLKNPGFDRDLVARTLGQIDEALAGADDLGSRFEALWRESRADPGG